MSCPIFCLRTQDDADPTLDLVNPDGCGNAIPTRSSFRDIDERFNYANGDIGKVPVRLQHQLTLSMDEVGPEIRQRLLDWKFKRTAVTLCPPTGSWPETEDTELIIVPSDQAAGAAFTDETGRYALEGNFSGSKYPWDINAVELIARNSSALVTEETTHGKGWRFHGDSITYASPPSPESANQGYGAGNSGWVMALDADVSVSHGSDFPAAAPYQGSLHFTNTGGGDSILYLLSTQLDPVADDAGIFHISIWLIGKMGQNARLDLLVENVLENSLDLSGKDYKQWTRVAVETYHADWTNKEPSVELHFNGATEDVIDFKVGLQLPTFLQGNSAGLMPHWTNNTSAIVPPVGTVATVDTSPATTAGTMTVDFVIPADADLANRNDFSLGLAEFAGGGGRGGLYLQRGSSGPLLLNVTSVPSSQSFELPDWTYSAGRHIYSVIYDSINDKMMLVIDGKLIEDRAVSVDAFTGGESFSLGTALGVFANSLFYFLSMRLDRVAMTAPEIISNQQIVLNDVARGTYELTQGRYYEIVSVPQTPLIQEGNAIWLGDVVLRQVFYDQDGVVWYADEGVS